MHTKHFVVYFRRGLAGDVKSILERGVRYTEDKLAPRHQITVRVYNREVLDPLTPDTPHVGEFHSHDAVWPEIHIAGKRHPTYVLETFFHEYVHYEQLIAGRDFSERGVNQRASSLASKMQLEGW